MSCQSEPISDAARLTLMNVEAFGLKFNVPLAFPLAVIAAVLIWFMFNRTTTGYEIKAVGMSKNAARYAGISISKNMILAMTLSGALAGLAGVTYFCCYSASMQPGVVPGMGFNAIAVALLGNANPIGCIFASFLITVISKGSIYMSSQQNVEIEIADLITAVILIFASCAEFLRLYVNNWSILPTLVACLIFGFARSGGQVLIQQLGMSSAYNDLVRILPYALTLLLLIFFSKHENILDLCKQFMTVFVIASFQDNSKFISADPEYR